MWIFLSRETLTDWKIYDIITVVKVSGIAANVLSISHLLSRFSVGRKTYAFCFYGRPVSRSVIRGRLKRPAVVRSADLLCWLRGLLFRRGKKVLPTIKTLGARTACGCIPVPTFALKNRALPTFFPGKEDFVHITITFCPLFPGCCPLFKSKVGSKKWLNHAAFWVFCPLSHFFL